MTVPSLFQYMYHHTTTSPVKNILAHAIDQIVHHHANAVAVANTIHCTVGIPHNLQIRLDLHSGVSAFCTYADGRRIAKVRVCRIRYH
jgi:hypothetical protein